MPTSTRDDRLETPAPILSWGRLETASAGVSRWGRLETCPPSVSRRHQFQDAHRANSRRGGVLRAARQPRRAGVVRAHNDECVSAHDGRSKSRLAGRKPHSPLGERIIPAKRPLARPSWAAVGSFMSRCTVRRCITRVPLAGHISTPIVAFPAVPSAVYCVAGRLCDCATGDEWHRERRTD